MNTLQTCSFLFFVLIFSSPPSRSEDLPESFSAYRLIKFPERGELYVSPDLATRKELFDIRHEGLNIVVFKAESYKYGVTFDMGASEDPGFTIYVSKDKKWKDIGYTSGYNLYIGATGSVYSEGQSNNNFNVRRKYRLQNGKLNETRQAFLLVDYQCKASNNVKIRSTIEESSNIVAVLPKDSSVKVIASKYFSADEDMVVGKNGYPFLVSTSFGLVGWVNITPGYLMRPGDPIGCITYFGD